MDSGLWDVPTGVTVRVSAKSMRQRFNGCEPEYIATTCHGACCRSSTAPGGISVAVAPIEVRGLVARGAVVIDGMIQPRDGERRCPFQSGDTYLCGLHGTDDKPFGCIASPFILTSKDTLVVRNRYRLLRCYDDGARLPAYVAFASSLRLLFGPTETRRIADHLAADGGDLVASMLPASYEMVRSVQHQRTPAV